MHRLVALVALLAFASSLAMAQSAFVYPKARRSTHVDTYHGTKVADPYRWLEDPDSAETKAWVEAQNKLTNAYLAKIPQRAALKARLTELWNYERYGLPWKRGGKYFFTRNSGLQNQAVLYVADTLNDKGRVLLDPNTLSPDGTVALTGTSVSPDGTILAYGLAASGSDWQEWRFRDVRTGVDMPDVIKHIKFSGVSWAKDNRGVYYSRYPAASEETKLEDSNYNQKLYFHMLGASQDNDVLIYERPDDKEIGISGNVTDDGEWLVMTLWKGTSPNVQVHLKNLKSPNARIIPLVDRFENEYSFIGNDGDNFFFKTDKNAPRGRIVSVDVDDARKEWKEAVPQAAEVIDSYGFVNDEFLISYLKDAYSQVRVFNREGNLIRNIELPGIGSAYGFGGERNDTETFFVYSSYNAPPTIYRYDLKAGRAEIFRKATVRFDPNDFEVRQVFFNSKDGTRVPMFLTHKKGLKMDGTNPTLLYGYGGFSASMTPNFSVTDIVWLERGGVFAVANIRGGAEYGEEWHLAGTKERKQNVFDDFIAAAEYLISSKVTSPKKLAIQGGSNGGLLVGAVLNQRPDLFGAALPAVGVMDMLRFHKFTIGHAWTSDYGSSDDPVGFRYLYKYSPLHNVKRGTRYPAVLVTTADHDDRVVPAHSFKYLATMQAAQRGPAPILGRIETKAGHGAGKPTSKRIDEAADVMAFLVKNLGMK
jgi:prolyl oligopeptidase